MTKKDFAFLFGLFCVLLGFNAFIGQNVIVSGSSMEDTLSDGDLLFMEKITKTFKGGNYSRFDIVVFDSHDDDEKYYIKRIIGLPGESVRLEDGVIYINGEPLEEAYGTEVFEDAGLAGETIVLGDGEYFVLGDNRNHSTDGRWLGAISGSDIKGRVVWGLWPWGSVE